MELDQLKESWKALDKAPPLPADLPTLLEKAERAAERPLRRMRRNIVRETIAIVVIYVIAFLQFEGPIMLPVGLFYAAMTSVALTYFFMKYRLLRGMETISADEDVFTHFSRKLRRLRSFLRFYMAVTFVLVIITMWFVSWLLWIYKRPAFYGLFGVHFHPGQEFWVVAGWTLIGLVLMIPGYYLARWCAYCFYGKYIDELEGSLRDLQQ